VLVLDRPASDALVRGSTNENHRLIDFLTQNRRSNLTPSALMLTVSNGPYFGMNYAVAPEQRVDDGLLTVSVFSRYSKLQLWWHFLASL
jgi:diacylglycerol kinase family enzyme